MHNKILFFIMSIHKKSQLCELALNKLVMFEFTSLFDFLRHNRRDAEFFHSFLCVHFCKKVVTIFLCGKKKQ